MRLLLIALPLTAALAGCGESADNFTPVDARIVAIEEECELSARETDRRRVNGETRRRTRSVSREGDCDDMLRLSRQSDYRNAEVLRELDITYEYVSPVDSQPHRGTGEREQPLDAAIPRVGDPLQILAHRSEADSSRLPAG